MSQLGGVVCTTRPRIVSGCTVSARRALTVVPIAEEGRLTDVIFDGYSPVGVLFVNLRVSSARCHLSSDVGSSGSSVHLLYSVARRHVETSVVTLQRRSRIDQGMAVLCTDRYQDIPQMTTDDGYVGLR